MILPHGHYSALGSSEMDIIKSWVTAGGKLIAIQGGVSKITRDEMFQLNTKRSQEPVKDEKSKLRKYGDQERSWLPNHLPGAIFKLEIDKTHPLCFGLEDHYFSLKTNSNAYSYLDDGWNIAYTGDQLNTIGFVGSKVIDKMKQSTCIASQSKGSGQVIYFMDNPVYRGFWKQGAFLLGNAIFIVN